MYSYIHVLPDRFLVNVVIDQFQFDLETRRAEHEYINIQNPQISVLVTALRSLMQTAYSFQISYVYQYCRSLPSCHGQSSCWLYLSWQGKQNLSLQCVLKCVLKLVKLQSLVTKCCNMMNIYLAVHICIFSNLRAITISEQEEVIKPAIFFAFYGIS